jgi:hypothetical protein
MITQFEESVMKKCIETDVMVGGYNAIKEYVEDMSIGMSEEFLPAKIIRIAETHGIGLTDKFFFTIGSFASYVA